MGESLTQQRRVSDEGFWVVKLCQWERKYIVLILFIILSCQPEELMIVEPLPQYEMIFEESQSSVTDGQEFSFEIISEEEHHLVISKDGSVITKESFLYKS